MHSDWRWQLESVIKIHRQVDNSWRNAQECTDSHVFILPTDSSKPAVSCVSRLWPYEMKRKSSEQTNPLKSNLRAQKVKAAFSVMIIIKTKHRSRLTNEHQHTCMRMALTAFQPRFETLAVQQSSFLSLNKKTKKPVKMLGLFIIQLVESCKMWNGVFGKKKKKM